MPRTTKPHRPTDAHGELRHTRRRLLELAGGSTDLDEDAHVTSDLTLQTAAVRCEIYEHPAAESRYRCDGESCSPGGESAGGCGCGDDREELGPRRYVLLVDEHDRATARLAASGSWRTCRATAALLVHPPRPRGVLRTATGKVAAVLRTIADRSPGCWLITIWPGGGCFEEHAAVTPHYQPALARAAAILYDAAVHANALLDSVPAEQRDCAHHELSGRAHDVLVQVTPGTPHPPHA